MTLLWLKRLWRCAEPACERRAWTETSEGLRARSVLTERVRWEACRLVGEGELDVAAAATTRGAGARVMRAVHERLAAGQRPLPGSPASMRSAPAATRKAVEYVSRIVHKLHLDRALSWLRGAATRLLKPVSKLTSSLGRTGVLAAATGWSPARREGRS